MATKIGPTYKYTKGVTFKGIQAQDAGEHLEALRLLHDGRLKPQDVVAEASNPESPMHAVFTWDDTKAADAYRLWEARQLIGMITVEFIDKPIAGEVRAFANVTIGGEQFYDSMRVVVETPSKRAQVLADAMREIESWKKRYAAIEELAGVRRAIGEVKVG